MSDSGSSRIAMNHAIEMAKQRRAVPEDIEQPGADAEQKRREVGQAAYDLNVQQYCCGGLNFGYYYDRSPIIAYDGEQQPGYTMYDFTASTVPGCRVPHFWLGDGRSLYDAMGDGFALLRLDHTLDVTPLEAAFHKRGIPFRTVDSTRVEAGDPYRHNLVLSRPDQHVAWRADAVPADPAALADLVTGARR